MATMYETIMDLPLLKGLSHEQVSSLLEKIHVEFITLRKGERLNTNGAPCDMLRFVISGKVRISMPTDDGTVILHQSVASGSAIGVEHLYGMQLTYPFTATAEEDSSIMQFSKRQYFEHLRIDPIYTINYCNYISARAQRTGQQLRTLTSGGIVNRLASILLLFTRSKSTNIVLEITRNRLISMCGSTLTDTDEQLAALSQEGIADYDGARLTIHTREGLIEKVGTNETYV